MITPASRQYNRLFRHYKNGFLAVEGQILDQPGKYVEAMEILDVAYNGIERDEAERRRRERP